MFVVHQAITAAQKAELYRFRYEVFVQEQRKYLRSADHARRELRDGLDEVATHLCLSENGQIIGAVRQVRGRRRATAAMAVQLGLDPFNAFPDEALSFTGRLLVLPQHRGSGGLLALFHQLYDRGRADGGIFDFIHCGLPMVKFYERLGYRRYRRHFHEADTGHQIPLALVADDLRHLDRIGSPLRARARCWPQQKQHSDWFARHSADYARVPGAVLPVARRPALAVAWHGDVAAVCGASSPS